MVNKQQLKLIHEQLKFCGTSEFTTAVNALLDDYYQLTAHMYDTETYITAIEAAMDMNDAVPDPAPRGNA